ncbi:MAG: glucokinase [Parvibaculum sp.]|nr:glucokinase [Parvibaculum sp.]
MYLVADIGGTNARFALAEPGPLRPDISPPSIYLTADYPSMEDALRAFLDASGKPEISGVAACAAGPVEGEGNDVLIRMTNCPWEVSVANLARVTGVAAPRLMNDFAALALSIPALERAELHAIGPALTPRRGAPVGILGAGTGLGISSLVFDGLHEIAVPGEGGHADLPPGSPREGEILARLQAKHGHVSLERVLSGPGLVALHAALCAIEGRAEGRLAPPEIARLAQAGDALAAEAIELFCGWLGAVAGNLALTLCAEGGIYIGGGIVPGWIEHAPGLFDEARFRARFEDKGRMSALLRRIPVFVIRRKDAALLGLARAARASSR